MKDRLSAILSALLGLLLYLATSYPAPDWLDAPELAQAAWRLGVFHPPGSPLAVLAGHLVWLASGNMPAVFSAVFAGASLYVLARLIQDLWQTLGPPERLVEQASVLLLISLFALTPGLWSQAVRCEVYTLALFLALCVLRELAGLTGHSDPAGADKRASRIAFLTGAGLAVHPLVALGTLAGVLSLLTSPEGRRTFLAPGHFLRLTVVGLLGAAPLFLIPLMLKLPADFRFGDPASLSGWLAFVSGSTFSPTFSQDTGPASGALPALAVLVSGLGTPIVIAGLMGLYLLARKNLRLALLLILVVVAISATLALQRSVRLDNPDASGYALLAMAAWFVCAAGFLAVAGRLLVKLHPKAGYAVIVLAALGTTGYGVFHPAAANRSGCTAGPEMAARSLSGQPENTVMILADFNLVFMFDYLSRVHSLRPDVRVVYLRDLDNRSFRQALARQDSGLEALLPGSRGLDQDSLERLAQSRPVALDPGPHLNPLELGPLSPRGLTWLLAPGDGPDTQRDFFKTLAPPICENSHKDPRSADVVTWHAYWHFRWARALGQDDLANWMLTVAACASPTDHLLAEAMSHKPDCPAPKASGLTLDPAGRPSWWAALLLGLGMLGWLAPLCGFRTRGYAGIAISLVGLGVMAISVVLI